MKEATDRYVKGHFLPKENYKRAPLIRAISMFISFTLLLIKKILEKKINDWGEHPKVGHSFDLELPLYKMFKVFLIYKKKILLWLNPFDLSDDREAVHGKDGGLSTLCHSCRFDYQQRVVKTLSNPGCLCPKNEVVRLTTAFTGKFLYIAYHFILLWLSSFVDRQRWWFEHSMS